MISAALVTPCMSKLTFNSLEPGERMAICNIEFDWRHSSNPARALIINGSGFDLASVALKNSIKLQ